MLWDAHPHNQAKFVILLTFPPKISFQPDPRIVRESLMDQIKRGANLKQTRDDE